MMKAKSNHQNKFMKILTIPIRALAKARDMYVNSMNTYADKVHYGPGPGFGSTSNNYALPRSLSSNSNSNEDFKELVRAASTNTLGDRLDRNNLGNLYGQVDQVNVYDNSSGRGRGVPRSASVGMAKIEEDKACDQFDDYNEVGKKDHFKVSKGKFSLFPRSRSYAVGTTNRPISSAF